MSVPSEKPLKIYLVGFMGSGKTTLGRLLANKLNVPFLDTDEEITKREGLSIREIFSLKGEGYFRRLERKVLEDLTKKFASFVMATGGGLGADSDAMDFMKANGVVIWLDVDFGEFKKRTFKDANRPLLQLSDEKLFELFQKRKNIYKKAHLRIDNTAPPEVAIEKILRQLNIMGY